MKKIRRYIVKIILILTGMAVLLHYLFLIIVEVPDLTDTIAEMNRGAELDFEYINQSNEFGLALQDMNNTCTNLSSGLLSSSLSSKQIEELVDKYAQQAQIVEEKGNAVLELKSKRSEEISKFQYARTYVPDSE